MADAFYTNSDGISVGSTKGWHEVITWQITRKRGSWPRGMLSPRNYDQPPRSVKKGCIRVSMVGHATLLIQLPGMNILTDPIWSHTAGPIAGFGVKRVVLPGIKFIDLPKIDVVLISHNHYDHMDRPTIQKLAKDHDPLFVVPTGNDRLLKKFYSKVRVVPLAWYQHFSFLPGINIWCYPAKHWSARTLFDRNKALWGAFVIESAVGNIYFAGDTGFGGGQHFHEAAQQFGDFILAMLPIGAFEPKWFMHNFHMGPHEAVQAAHLLRAKHSIAMHFDTFNLADDAFHQALNLLQGIVNDTPGIDFRAIPPGEHLLIAG